ncbi:hypothetical protein CPLU01_03502 [Colletotrichum plurivorum]|uniref:F-box domain-containing protein n=1 Tax=Colletotrichum plurivorum TaxID=2175906 RepID=A0A8H6KT88_9PEZI|nr:hypothetical protein CPLU01_03502 [Colletotrichum plurivorum]
MTSLLDLPQELVHKILSSLVEQDPGPYRFRFEDAEPSFNTRRLKRGLSTLAKLCRTCRVLRELVEPLLYHFVYIPDATVAPLASLLRCWQSRPHCAAYTRRLTVETKWAPGGTPPQAMRDQDVAFATAMAKQLGVHARENWHEHTWNTDILVELALFCCARSVRTVELEFCQLRGIYRPAFEGLLPEHGGAEHVRFPSLEYLYLVQAGWRIAELDHVLHRAPSLSTLRLFMCDFNYPSRAFPENITNLCILRCPITPARLESIIREMGKLTRVEFTIWRGQPEDLARVIGALSKHARTLKSLTVCFGWNRRSGSPRVKVPLDALTSLESLTTDVRSFGSGPTGLVQSLPTSLRKLRLIRSPETTAEELQSFACEMMDAKARFTENPTVLLSGPEYWEELDGNHDTVFDYESTSLRI